MLSSIFSALSLSLGLVATAPTDIPDELPSQLSSPCRLPLELVDYTIDFAHSDKDTLSACTLVCKAWLPSARYHLFSQISLHGNNFRAFFSLIKSKSFDMSLVRELEIRVGARRADSLTSSFATAILPKLNEQKLLPNVTSLSLYGLDLTQPLLISFATLRHLDLDALSAKSFNLVAALLCTLPSLHSLRVDSTFDEPWALPASLPAAPVFLELSSLELSRCTAHFLEWLLTFSIIPKVSTLTLCSVECDTIPVISRYLAIAGPVLTSLSFVFPMQWDDDVYLDLSQNTSLQSLSITTYAHEMRTVANLTLSRLPNPAALTTLFLTFTGTFVRSFALPRTAGAHLDNLVALTGVQTLRLAAWPISRRWRKKDRTELRAMFPRAVARGVVVVHRLTPEDAHKLCPLPSLLDSL